MNSSIWEHFASGSFSPSTSPAFLSGPGAAELARLRQELDEANSTIKQWEESWKQAKQVPFSLQGKREQPLNLEVFPKRRAEITGDAVNIVQTLLKTVP